MPRSAGVAMPNVCIRPVTRDDAAEIARIYNHYIRATVVTFEEQEVTDGEMVRRFDAIAGCALPWLVAQRADRVVGYAYADRWKQRSAYRRSVESTIYLHPDYTGAGIGTRLYRQLLAQLPASIHTVIGGIAQPNVASVTLHERLGFSKVAHFRDVGFKFERWIDVGYWQRQR